MKNISATILSLPGTANSHAHAFHQLVIGISGQAEFEINGKGDLITPVRGCVIPSEFTHYYSGIGDNHCLIVNIPSDYQFPGPDYDTLAFICNSPRYFSVDTYLQKFLSFASHELKLQPENKALEQNIAFTLANSLYSRIKEGESSPIGPLDMSQIDQYIITHLNSKLSVDELARHVNKSSSHFHSLFRDMTGTTPHQYVLQMRLNEAQRLIEQTRLPLNVIAEQAGFTDQSALTHAFKQYKGSTPGQLRKACKITVQ